MKTLNCLIECEGQKDNGQVKSGLKVIQETNTYVTQLHSFVSGSLRFRVEPAR